MKLRIQLIIAFLLLAVLPLAVVTFYSYNASIRAFRKAMESEAGAVAQEMGDRMESVRDDLSHRIERLGRFPFKRLMVQRDGKFPPESGPLFAQLAAEIGDAASFVDSLEFTPSAPPPPADERSVNRPSPPAAGTHHSSPDDAAGLVIHLGPEATGGNSEDLGAVIENEVRRRVIHLMLPRLDANHLLSAETGGMEADTRANPAHNPAGSESEVKSQARTPQGTSLAHKQINEAKPADHEAHRKQQENSVGRTFRSVVLRDGQTIGTLNAQIKSQQILRSVLSRTRRRQGELPFAIDAQGKLHTADPADSSRLQGLSLTPALIEGSVATQSTAFKNWVIVTRKDKGSGLTFGIARPVGDSLEEIRRTAVRILGIGLGMIGLALIGILFQSGRMTRHLTVLTQGAEKLAHGSLETRVPELSRNEFGRLAQAFNRMAHELQENQKRLLEQERLRKELELCRRIQEELLPRRPLHAGRVEVKGVSMPAQEVGGDFFNYFPLPNGDIGVIVGDVSGKGLPAALLMANLHSMLQARLTLAGSLTELARDLDREIGDTTPPEQYLAIFLGILDTRRFTLRYVNAGHHTQFALHAGGTLERIESTGRPLGLLPGGGYVERQVQFGGGDFLFLYTDGLVEAEDAFGVQFGMDRLEALLVQQRTSKMEVILARVEEAIQAHRGAAGAIDDATMLVLNVAAAAAAAQAGAQTGIREICTTGQTRCVSAVHGPDRGELSEG